MRVRGGRHERGYDAERSSAIVLVFAALSLVAAGYVYATGVTVANACSIEIGGRVSGRGLVVSPVSAGPWRDGDIAALTAQIPQAARQLRPGFSGSMVAYVRNTGNAPGTPSLSIADLVDDGGVYTEPEHDVEPRRDVGDLSANIVLTVTYASSLRASEAPRVVARGTLRELAARGRVLVAPRTIQPFSARGSETGTWRVDLAIPPAADNRIQGDRSGCTMVFGLS